MLILNQVSCSGLKDLSFSVKRGEFVFVYDHTPDHLRVIRELINGDKRPESGIIRWINDYDYSKELLHEDIGIVYEDNILLSDRTLMDNLHYVFHIKGSQGKLFYHRMERILQLVGLTGLQDKFPRELNPHQLIRANIAQALLNYPSLLVLEDPTRFLDEVNSQGVYHLLEKINDLSTTIVFLSSDHDLVFRNQRRTINLERKLKRGEKGSYA